MQTSVLQWGNWGSEMSLSRLAQGHTTSRSQAGSSSRPRLCAARLPLPAAPQMESSSLGDGATGTAVHRQLGRALRYSGGLTLSIACPPPPPLPPSWQRKHPEGLQGVQRTTRREGLQGLQKRCILWDTGKSSRATGSWGRGCAGWGRWPNAASSAAAAQQRSGGMIRQGHRATSTVRGEWAGASFRDP